MTLCLSYVLLLLIFFFSFSHGQQYLTEKKDQSNFSGFFIPDKIKTASDFAASFIISKEAFIAAESAFQGSRGIAGVTFSVVRRKCPNCATFATRDYFDFFVEHLSPYSNYIPFDRSDMVDIVSKKMEYRASIYRKHALTQNYYVSKQSITQAMNSTLVIIPFSTKAFSKHTDFPAQIKIRQSFFEVTFWSVYRYFSQIAVITSMEDLPQLKELHLPIYHTVVIGNLTLSKYNKTDSLPRQGVDQILQHMKQGKPKFKPFQYVFFTEGDQIVHMRGLEQIIDFIQSSGGKFVGIPHRFNSFLLSSEFTPDFQKYFTLRKSNYAQDLPASIVTIQEPSFDPSGSCCEDGLYEIEDCKYGWWYQCHEWGIKDMFPWFRFGESGFPIPPVTEHRRSCQYYPTRTTCDMPVTCEERTPQKKLNNPTVQASQLCPPYNFIKYIGPTTKLSTINNNTLSHFETYQQKLSEFEKDEKELHKAILEVSRLRKRVKQSRKALKAYAI